MKFAVNYSPQAADLLADQRIALDLFKCHPIPEILDPARASLPIYIHFPLNTCDDSIASADWQRYHTLLEETGTPYINLHLTAPASQFPHLPVDTSHPAHFQEVADRMIRDVEAIAKHCGAKRVIVENVVYRGPDGKTLYPSVAPEVITRIVRETGCGLLLDTAHATLTAEALGIATQDYIAQLPTGSIREWHVTGVQFHAAVGKLRDSMPMQEADWRLTEWAMAQIASGRWSWPWVVALEYGGIGPIFEWRSEPEVLAEQAPRLHALMGAV